jgi:hypothetical protein
LSIREGEKIAPATLRIPYIHQTAWSFRRVTRVRDDVLEMLAALPTPEEILNLRPSPRLAARVSENDREEPRW